MRLGVRYLATALQGPVDGMLDEMDSLLRGQTRDDSNDRLLLRVLQLTTRLQGRLALAFSFTNVGHPEVPWDEWVNLCGKTTNAPA